MTDANARDRNRAAAVMRIALHKHRNHDRVARAFDTADEAVAPVIRVPIRLPDAVRTAKARVAVACGVALLIVAGILAYDHWGPHTPSPATGTTTHASSRQPGRVARGLLLTSDHALTTGAGAVVPLRSPVTTALAV